MKKPVVLKLWTLACILTVLNACQKETTNNDPQLHTDNSSIRATGALPDDPALVAKVPVIMSSEFKNAPNARNGKGGKQTDSDGDGITDNNDNCPLEPETMNGYQDGDGCPDTAPAPTTTDTDGDGIADTTDACPTQAETFNGYEDSDGCPDTPPAPEVIQPTTLPPAFQLQMPAVQQQGGEFSCVAMATAAARSVEYFYKTNATGYSYSTNIFSPEYLYNQTKASTECSSGTGIYTCLNLVKNQGICTWQTMPYSSTNGCSLMPTSSQVAEAANYKITTFSLVMQDDQVAIKTLLAQNHPLIAGTSIDNNFTNATPGFIWNSFSGSYGTNHAYVLCGYDDAKHAYKVMNSWGTGWGENGYSWIDYDFFGTLPGSVYVINN